jgi:hypothetical protein
MFTAVGSFAAAPQQVHTPRESSSTPYYSWLGRARSTRRASAWGDLRESGEADPFVIWRWSPPKPGQVFTMLCDTASIFDPATTSRNSTRSPQSLSYAGILCLTP